MPPAIRPTGITVAATAVVALAVLALAAGPPPDATSEATPPVAQPGPPLAATDDVIVAQPSAHRSAEAAEAAELRLRYAAARLRLAELDLERAVAANRMVPGAVGDRELARLRNHVTLMQRQFEIARALPRTAVRQATIAAAELAGDNARVDLDAALKANHRVPGSVSDLNIERLRARLELAEIRVALCRNPAFELSLLDEMQWSIDQLTDQLIDLRHQVETRGTADVGKPD